ncbi:MAG TPA: outer membrane protein assembly factor BamA, partial [Gemmatirosa sp.]
MRFVSPRVATPVTAGISALLAAAVGQLQAQTPSSSAPAPAGSAATAPVVAPADSGARCAAPDTVIVRGLSRISATTAVGDIGISPRSDVGTPQLQAAIRRLYATGEFDDVRVGCELQTGGRRAALVFTVRERPVLQSVDVAGSASDLASVRGKLDLVPGSTVDPSKVAAAVARLDSSYQARGFYLARVRPESTITADNRLKLVFHIDEGSRLAISGVRVNGNKKLTTAQVVGAMQTKPEGFWWWRKGAFDEDKFAGDIAERLPAEYASNGLLDFQVLRDTLIIDRARGKAVVDLTVREGPQYKIGRFEITDNRRFSTDELKQYYPFTGAGPTLTERVAGAVRGNFRAPAKDVFDQARWDAATERVLGAYHNEGYLYARVTPIVERARVGPDSTPVVNLRWQVDEKAPVIINRIEIAGNDYTTDECIRRQLVILPGDVFNQDRLMRSWQNIGNLNFFDTPLSQPDTRPANENGDLDVIFRVKEKRTGSFNFGASVGGSGVGVGGFIGVDQPNLFGQCKRGSVNWNFGRYVNDFELQYTDPALRKSRVSGTTSLYRRQSRYTITGFGDNTVTTGASVRLGFPVPGSFFSTLGVSYTAEATSYKNADAATLQSLGYSTTTCLQNCFRSALGLDFTHDTRIDLPYPSAGGIQALTLDFNGGPLGGRTTFQRITGQAGSFVTLAQFGGGLADQPKKIVFGLTGRGGAIIGDPGAFFAQQAFAVGGVQYGQQLRGYPEFSITPRGF